MLSKATLHSDRFMGCLQHGPIDGGCWRAIRFRVQVEVRRRWLGCQGRRGAEEEEGRWRVRERRRWAIAQGQRAQPPGFVPHVCRGACPTFQPKMFRHAPVSGRLRTRFPGCFAGVACSSAHVNLGMSSGRHPSALDTSASLPCVRLMAACGVGIAGECGCWGLFGMTFRTELAGPGDSELGCSPRVSCHCLRHGHRVVHMVALLSLSLPLLLPWPLVAAGIVVVIVLSQADSECSIAPSSDQCCAECGGHSLRSTAHTTAAH